MNKYICTKSENSNFACPCERCAKDFIENMESFWGVSEKRYVKICPYCKQEYGDIVAHAGGMGDKFCIKCGKPTTK